MSKTILLFVYGTLKRGYGNNLRCLPESQAEFVGEAVTEQGYNMKDAGVPFLFDEVGGPAAKGEVFRITEEAFANCDILEGHPRMYKREERKMVLISGDRTGETVTAWVYLYQRSTNGCRPVPTDASGALVWSRDTGPAPKVYNGFSGR